MRAKASKLIAERCKTADTGETGGGRVGDGWGTRSRPVQRSHCCNIKQDFIVLENRPPTSSVWNSAGPVLQASAAPPTGRLNLD